MTIDVDVKQIFARRLRGLREAVGLSQGELAEKLGVSRGSISFYENESRVPDIVFLESVSEFFDVGINFLLGHSENRNPSNEDLGLYIDFSDKAIEKLLVGGNNYGMALSSLIESDHFEELFNIAEYFFLPLSFGSKPEFFDRGLFSDEFEYCAYQVSRIFAAMLVERKADVVNYFFDQFKYDFSNGDYEKKQFLEKRRDEELARINELKAKQEAWLANERDTRDAEYMFSIQNSEDRTERIQRYEATRAYMDAESGNKNGGE